MTSVIMRIPAEVQKELNEAVRRNTNNWRKIHNIPMRRKRGKIKNNRRNIHMPFFGMDELGQLYPWEVDAFQKMRRRTFKESVIVLGSTCRRVD